MTNKQEKKEAATEDHSIEEILDSIRRIISDEEPIAEDTDSKKENELPADDDLEKADADSSFAAEMENDESDSSKALEADVDFTKELSSVEKDPEEKETIMEKEAEVQEKEPDLEKEDDILELTEVVEEESITDEALDTTESEPTSEVQAEENEEGEIEMVADEEKMSVDDIDALMAADTEAPAEKPDQKSGDLPDPQSQTEQPEPEIVMEDSPEEQPQPVLQPEPLPDSESKRLAEGTEELQVPQETEPVKDTSSLLSEETASSALGAMEKMAQTVRAEEEKKKAEEAVQVGGISLDEIVRQEVRPMIKQWLDTHLPEIVERTVEKELEKLRQRLDG